ncbi:cation-transporting P-type ATPase, partial [Patescibacteria group bacterium]|nr:cation-transporting P-type ATPase [Patescibacteria group bacterium]
RKIPAVETLGSVQIILTDKTGTLTENRMKVKNAWIRDANKIDHVYKACILGNSASLIEKGGGKFDTIGDKTDGALLVWAKKEKGEIELLNSEGEIEDEFVFDPKSKIITTVWKKGQSHFVYVRGAPEVILEKSKGTLAEKEKIKKTFETEARKGLRIIAFGMKHEKSYKKAERNYLEKDLEFLGFVAIADPLRKGVRESVEKARKAGIKTIMVTGDNELTALTIAREAGIAQDNDDVITGEQLSKLSDEELGKIIFQSAVFARTKPEDKLRLVTVIKKNGLVVGVTGDGVNDALALKQADVGIAMGKKGTDVAKEASDIVLTDDNYSTLVSAVLEGRTIYNNIVKAITYLLSGNLSEISLVFFATILALPAPLVPTQILWINLITDGLPALALASDNRNKSVLDQRPRDPKEPIITKERLIFILIVGFSLSFVLFFVFYLMLNFYNPSFARTITFNLVIVLHMGFIFAIRGKMAFKFNKFLVFTVVLSLFLQLLINIVPFLREIFHLSYSL